MILDSFRQDVRVGLRVLFKEKSFCFLATLVLALGICGTDFELISADYGWPPPGSDRAHS